MGKDCRQSRKENILIKYYSETIDKNVRQAEILDRKLCLHVSLCQNFLKEQDVEFEMPNDTELIPNNKKYEFSCFENFDNHLKWNIYTPSKSLFSDSISQVPAENIKHEKIELARLEDAIRQAELMSLHADAKEASILAKIDCLECCLNGNAPNYVVQDTDSLEKSCEELRNKCIKLINRLGVNDFFELGCLQAEQRKYLQEKRLKSLDDNIKLANLERAKLEMIRDILAFEDENLLKLSSCLNQATSSFQQFVALINEVRFRIEPSTKSIAKDKDNFPSKSLFLNGNIEKPIEKMFSDIDYHLQVYLLHLFKDVSLESKTHSEDLVQLNERLMKSLDVKSALVKEKSAETYDIMKEFTKISKSICNLMSKAVHRLDCMNDAKVSQQKARSDQSTCLYWKSLSPLVGLLPLRLIDRILETRNLLDNLQTGLRDLDFSFELNEG